MGMSTHRNKTVPFQSIIHTFNNSFTIFFEIAFIAILSFMLKKNEKNFIESVLM